MTNLELANIVLEYEEVTETDELNFLFPYNIEWDKEITPDTFNQIAMDDDQLYKYPSDFDDRSDEDEDDYIMYIATKSVEAINRGEKFTGEILWDFGSYSDFNEEEYERDVLEEQSFRESLMGEV